MSKDWYATDRPAGAIPVSQWRHWHRTEAGPAVATDLLAVHQSYLKQAHLTGLFRLAKKAQVGRELNSDRPRLHLANAAAELHRLEAQCGV